MRYTLNISTFHAPHIRNKKSTQIVMLDVIIAMLPALFASIYYFGLRSLYLILVSVTECVLSESVMQKLLHKKVRVRDLSAVVTGILLAFNLPVTFPFWMTILGAIFSIVIVKELFGGIGQNFMNPALAGRAFLMITWPTQMTNFTIDGVASATPLGRKPVEFLELFLGNIPGTIGEVSKLAIILGLVYLVARGVIKLRMPLTYFFGSAFFLFILKYDVIDTFYQLFSGGIILAAVFMITDYSSSPMTPKGQYIYSLGAALLTVLIRIYGGYPEGVSFAILIMNVFVPLIDKYVKTRVFGIKEAKK
ncbi:RnfABCDGE type electron transport complex subunit D [Helcococcus ovis]|uniref:RnfABCDGE type electron transport complex subunit D n=1 Tax=Helcococcus ovis TaxID=72026 RepID=UPI0038B9B77F